ncbi:MAG: hypothetical protein ABIZ05_00625 [Pseudonocardiaceae bacterium]
MVVTPPVAVMVVIVVVVAPIIVIVVVATVEFICEDAGDPHFRIPFPGCFPCCLFIILCDRLSVVISRSYFPRTVAHVVPLN